MRLDGVVCQMSVILFYWSKSAHLWSLLHIAYISLNFFAILALKYLAYPQFHSHTYYLFRVFNLKNDEQPYFWPSLFCNRGIKFLKKILNWIVFDEFLQLQYQVSKFKVSSPSSLGSVFVNRSFRKIILLQLIRVVLHLS